MLSEQYPHLNLDTDKIFIRDGALSTTAGVTAGMDLALAMVEEDRGRNLALTVARYMVMFLKRPGGQSQFSAHLAAQMSGMTRIQRVQEFVLSHLAASLSVEDLAAEAGMSVRNFARVFRAETGVTPADFVDQARLDAALAGGHRSTPAEGGYSGRLWRRHNNASNLRSIYWRQPGRLSAPLLLDATGC
jgi:transcriptional regulator GlxA family with amidase domain